MKQLLFIILITGLFTSRVPAQVEFGEMQNLSNEYGPSDEHDIANIGSNYFLVWNQWGDIMFRRSQNGGLNWGEKITLYSAFDYGGSYPVVAAGGNNVYVAYYRNTSNNSQVFMVKSVNGGHTFGNEIQVTNAIKLAQVPQIVASGDTVVVAYEDRDLDWNYQIYLTISTDAGATWSEPVNLSNTQQNARWCNLAMQGQSLVALWNDQTGPSYNDLDLFFTKSNDFGLSWTTPVNITNNGWYNARLNTQIMESSIYVIVSSKINNLQTDIMLYHSEDFGNTWATPVNLSDNSGDSERPDLWVTPNYSGNHRIYAVWSDGTYSGNKRAYMKYSIDNGYSWSEMLEFSNQTEDAGWVQIIGEATGPADQLYTAWYRPDDGTFNYEVWGRSAVSQVSAEVNLSGVITNQDGDAVGNATVALGGYLTFSQEDGSYSLDVPAGSYNFSVSASGYQNYQQPLVLSEDTILDVVLQSLIPGNYPPHNLNVQQQGVNGIFANWEEPIGFNSIELFYDDGEANGLFWVGTATGNEMMAVAFEHDEPFYLRQAKLFTSPGYSGEQMKVYILGDTGGFPSPEIVLGGPYMVEVETGWTSVNFDIPLPANNRFYVTCQWEEDNLYKVGGDLNQPDGFSYSTADGGQSWFVHDEMDFMIRAGIATDGKMGLSLLDPVNSRTGLIGYQPYLGEEPYGGTITEQYIAIGDLEPGQGYLFGVSAIYDDGESPVVSQEIFIPEPLLFPPLNLTGEVITEGALLTWDEPASQGIWMYWDNGINSDAVGGENVEIFDAAIRFESDDLNTTDGHYLTRINIYIADADCQIFLRVWQGGNQNYAGTLIREQLVAYPIADNWNEIELASPVLIDAAQELWFGYRVINTGGVYPAGTDSGPAIPFKGDMLLYGSDWVSMSTYFGWDINWNIQGMAVDPGNGKLTALGNSRLLDQKIKNPGEPQRIKTGRSGQPPLRWQYSHFNVYNNGVMIGTSPSGTLEFLDPDLFVNNVYTVTTAWDSFESPPSNAVVITHTGITETVFKQGKVNIWPNPVSNELSVSFFSSSAEKTVVSMYDSKGEEVAVLFAGKPKQGENRLQVSLSHVAKNRLPNGIYFLDIRQGQERSVGKFVVVRE
jgi:hypothetical protein